MGVPNVSPAMDASVGVDSHGMPDMLLPLCTAVVPLPSPSAGDQRPARLVLPGGLEPLAKPRVGGLLLDPPSTRRLPDRPRPPATYVYKLA